MNEEDKQTLIDDLRAKEQEETAQFNAWRARCTTDAEFRHAEQKKLRRFICTPSEPFNEIRGAEYGGRVTHPYAEDNGGDEVVRYTCLICLQSWREELPQ